ncbi:MAG: dienelactone hydrolase family protein [Gemmatimonadales bacterium]
MSGLQLVAPAPHGGRPVRQGGAPMGSARGALILLHGRGATAESMFDLAQEVSPPDLAWWAPSAARNTWYPESFLVPMEQNEPALSSAFAAVHGLIETLSVAGFPPERIALLGFSQGACLTLEYAARHAKRFGALIGLSGGLIGPPGTPRGYTGSFSGTPVFLGCSDVDFHIPVERVRESAEAFRRMGAQVDERIYPGMGHTVNDDELNAVRGMLGSIGLTV